MADQISIDKLRLLAGAISSAINSYENAKGGTLDTELTRIKIVDAANELLFETDDPLQRLFVISHQVTELSAH